MDTSTNLRTTDSHWQQATPLSWQAVLKILLLNVLIWTTLSLVGALTSLNDDLREGVQGDFWLIFLSWCSSSLVLAALSFILMYGFSRWPWFLSSKRHMALGYALLLLIVLPCQLLYVSKLFTLDGPHDMNWDSIAEQLQVFDKLATLLHLSSISAVYFAVVTVKIWQQSQERNRALAQERSDALTLRLELEQQKSLALRAQLEPHFMFNALNAISALVISDNKEVALNGIQGLSELLRYALAAGDKNWVKLGDELAFIQDYLALQRLRYGERLHIVIQGMDQDLADCDCLPLLLQPLIENALRHDLDCHEDASDILCSLEKNAGQIWIRISNPIHAEAAANPGVGLGLRNTAARLQLAYGEAASLQTGIQDGRFELMLRIPESKRE